MRHHGKTYVRWNDLDAFGHINNANYLTFIQEVRADFTWYSRIAKGLKPMFSDMVVARAEIDYLEPINAGGFEIDIAVWVSKIGNSSFTLEYELTSKAGVHARARTVQVAVDMATKRSRAINDEERTLLTQYLEHE
jgi:acyl-CoA thioester hydrolase